MSILSINTELKFNLNGSNIDYPLSARDIQILATFENESVNANISTEEFEFVNNEAKAIRQYILDGSAGGVGIFEGMPLTISAYNKDSQYLAFNGYLNLSDGFVDSETKVASNIKKSNGLNSLDERLSAISLGYLESIDVLNSSHFRDIKYVVYKNEEFIDILLANVILFLLIKESIEAIRDTALGAAAVASMLAILPGGSIGSFLYLAALVILQAAYTTAIVIATIQLVEDMINRLAPPIRKSKVLKQYETIEAIAAHLGLSFESPIEELGTLFYLPSNPSTDSGLTSGVPQTTDFGYQCADFFALMEQLYNAKFVIVENTLHLRTKSDPFFENQSTWIIPDVKTESKSYNTEDFKANRVIALRTDLSDEWTIDNFTGTNYEVITNANIVNNTEANYLIGLDYVNIPLALGNRKNSLSNLEILLADVAGVADTIINAFGGSSNLQNQIQGKVGYLKVSSNNYSVPKLIPLSGEKLPTNHRSIISAKLLYDKYHIEKSFVSNDYKAQHVIYSDISIPFGFEDFLELINNSYCNTIAGEKAKITKLEWNMLQDKANISYWIEKPYTKNLVETFIEA